MTNHMHTLTTYLFLLLVLVVEFATKVDTLVLCHTSAIRRHWEQVVFNFFSFAICLDLP